MDENNYGPRVGVHIRFGDNESENEIVRENEPVIEMKMKVHLKMKCLRGFWIHPALNMNPMNPLLPPQPRPPTSTNSNMES